MRKSRKAVFAASVCAFALFLSACNTMEGLGKDLESAGDKAEEVTKKK